MQLIQEQPPEVFYKKKDVLKNFAIFTRKNLCWSLLSIDLRASSPATSVNIVKFLRTFILMKICEQLLPPFLLLTVNISS